MVRFILRIAGNSLALFVATKAVSGFGIQGSYQGYLLAGGALAILNLIVRPILKTISFPLIIITLGLFILVINGIILWILDYAFDFIVISDLTALIWATIIVAIVNFFISVSLKIIV